MTKRGEWMHNDGRPSDGLVPKWIRDFNDRSIALMRRAMNHGLYTPGDVIAPDADGNLVAPIAGRYLVKDGQMTYLGPADADHAIDYIPVRPGG